MNSRSRSSRSANIQKTATAKPKSISTISSTLSASVSKKECGRRTRSRKRKPKTKEYQEAKLDRLLDLIKLDNTSIFNLSNRQLSKTESVLLGFGFKFLPRYRRSTDSILHSLRSSLHKFQRNLKWKLHFAFNNNINSNNNNNFMIPKIENNNSIPNYTKDSQEYLDLVDDYIVECNNRIDQLKPKSVVSRIDQFILNAIVSIKNRTHIVIKPADKNLGVAVMSVEDYSAICYKILDDKQTYLKANSLETKVPSPKYIDSA
jgi:hypothetical protein